MWTNLPKPRWRRPAAAPARLCLRQWHAAFTIKPITLSYRLPDGRIARRTFVTLASHHGPIVREENGKWIAFALMNKPAAALQQSFARTKASDLAGFLKVAELKANSSNNTLFADDKGEIAYLHPQFVPVRDDSFRLARAGGRQQPRHRMEGAARARHTAAGDQPGQRLGLQHQQRAVERGGGRQPAQGCLPALHGSGRGQPARAARRTRAGRQRAFHAR
jgi:hypothetical protein